MITKHFGELGYKDILRRTASIFEIDKAVGYAFFARLWSAPQAFITIIVLTKYLTPEEQGYYYTFFSLSSIYILFELGFASVVLNIAAHIAADLKISNTGAHISGPEKSRERLQGLGQLSFRLYTGIALLFLLCAGLLGEMWLELHKGTALFFQWWGLIAFTAANLALYPMLTLAEGCNLIFDVNRIRFYQQVGAKVCLWVCLALGTALWSVVGFSLFLFLSSLYFVTISRPGFFKHFNFTGYNRAVSWRREVFPLQWRIGFGAAASFFSVSIFVPLIFRYDGPIAAGAMGITLQATALLHQLAMVWITVKAPQLAMYAGERAYRQMDNLWWKCTAIALLMTLVGGLGLWGLFVCIYSYFPKIAVRILSPSTAGIFILAAFFLQVSHCQTAYLRAHKIEPTWLVTVVTNVLSGVLAYVLGARYGAVGIASGYLSTSLLAALWGTWIWNDFRKKLLKFEA